MTQDEILLTSILNCQRSDLYTGAVSLSHRDTQEFFRKKNKLSCGIPLQYVIGNTEFFGLVFKVDERVFIPRPETEILVEEALKYIRNRNVDTGINILEIGTGSGCIAVSLAKNLNRVKITALDISYLALEVARENAKINSVEEKIYFGQSDIFLKCVESGTYDMIISNPPYIASCDMELLPQEVRREPAVALDGGPDGLGFYRRIIKEAPRFLKRDGLLFLEMGCGQCPAIKNIFQNTNNFEIIEVAKDYNNIERVAIARRKDG